MTPAKPVFLCKTSSRKALKIKTVTKKKLLARYHHKGYLPAIRDRQTKPPAESHSDTRY